MAGSNSEENYDKVEWKTFGTQYLLRGTLHRLDGPAIEYKNGNKTWYQNGLVHRTDGPAFTWANGGKLWFFRGKEYPFKEWLEKVWEELPAENKKKYIYEGFKEG